MKACFAVLAFVASSVASAACYQIHSSKNELVWQNPSPPVPMDKPAAVSAEINKMAPGGHLIIIEATPSQCRPIDLLAQDRTLRKKAEKIKYD